MCRSHPDVRQWHDTVQACTQDMGCSLRRLASCLWKKPRVFTPTPVCSGAHRRASVEGSTDEQANAAFDAHHEHSGARGSLGVRHAVPQRHGDGGAVGGVLGSVLLERLIRLRLQVILQRLQRRLHTAQRPRVGTRMLTCTCRALLYTARVASISYRAYNASGRWSIGTYVSRESHFKQRQAPACDANSRFVQLVRSSR